MTTLGENIRKFRIIKNMTQLDLAKQLNVSDKTVSSWETGEKIPRMGNIEKIAALFHINKSELIDNNETNRPRIPVLGKVVAGYPMDAVENIIDYEEISEQMAKTGEFFALQVQGDSMNPRFVDGDVVIVRKQEDVDSGDIAIILVNGDEATIKKVQKFEGGINLIPANPAYDVLTYSNEEIENLPVRCLGKVVELRAKF